MEGLCVPSGHFDPCMRAHSHASLFLSLLSHLVYTISYPFYFICSCLFFKVLTVCEPVARGRRYGGSLDPRVCAWCGRSKFLFLFFLFYLLTLGHRPGHRFLSHPLSSSYLFVSFCCSILVFDLIHVFRILFYLVVVY